MTQHISKPKHFLARIRPAATWRDHTLIQTAEEVVIPLLDGDGKTSTFIIPAGVVTDGASTPRILAPLVRRFGRTLLPAIAHDYALRSLHWSRRQADQLILDAMRGEGVHPAQSKPVYWAVRIYSMFVSEDHDRERRTL